MGTETLREQLEAAAETITSNESELEATAETSISNEVEDEEQISTDQPEAKELETPPTLEEQLEAPQFWSDEYKEAFKKIPPELRPLQKYLVDREKENQSNFTRSRQKEVELQRSLAERDGIFSNYQEAIAASGMQPWQYAQALMMANERLMQDPVSGLRQMAEALGVAPQQLLGTAEQFDGRQVDPRLAEVQAQLREVQNWRAQQERERQELIKAQNEQKLEQLSNEIQTIIDQKDENGKAKFAHLEQPEVLNEVIALANVYKGLTPNQPISSLIERAYRKAIADNPIIQKELEQEKARAEQSKAAQKAAAARQGGKSLSPTLSNDDVEEDLSKLTLREQLEHQANKLG